AAAAAPADVAPTAGVATSATDVGTPTTGVATSATDVGTPTADVAATTDDVLLRAAVDAAHTGASDGADHAGAQRDLVAGPSGPTGSPERRADDGTAAGRAGGSGPGHRDRLGAAGQPGDSGPRGADATARDAARLPGRGRPAPAGGPGRPGRRSGRRPRPQRHGRYDHPGEPGLPGPGAFPEQPAAAHPAAG